MIRERIVVRRRMLSPRQRVPLTVVRRGEPRGWEPDHERSLRHPLRGLGPLDYVCGSCGGLLELGVAPGSFATALLVCACGAVNQVPHDCAHA
jgi:hypothetical protein